MSSNIQVTPEYLFSQIGRPGCPVLIDGRIDEDFNDDPRLIPGSVRLPCFDAPSWAPGFAGREIVVICDRGLKLSEGAAAWARALGVRAVNLGGGYRGWRDAGFPVIPDAAVPDRDSEGRTIWVTGADPRLDTLASAWLVRRFVDPKAVILFVTPREVAGVANRMAVTPLPPFGALAQSFDPNVPGLGRLLDITRGDGPEAPGLEAQVAGLFALYSDQLERLDAAIGLLDALYGGLRQC